MASSRVEIWNRALTFIGTPLMQSETDGSKGQRICSANWVMSRNRVFRSHPWSCLIVRSSLTREVSTVPGWDGYVYAIPADCIRLIDASAEYRIEGTQLLSRSDVVVIRYISSDTDVTAYDSYLDELLALRLAADIAPQFSESAKMASLLEEKYIIAFRQAAAADYREHRSPPVPPGSWADAR